MSANHHLKKLTTLVLPLTAWFVSCVGGNDNDDIYTIINMSGEIDSTVALSDLTEVRVSNDLVFLSDDSPGLRINGRVRFVIAPYVNIVLPRVTETTVNSEWTLVSSSNFWGRITIPTNGTLTANGIRLEDAHGGLHFQDGASGEIDDLNISNCYAGLSMSSTDTLSVQHIEISSCEVGIDLTSESCLILSGGSISTCTTGIKNTESTLLASDITISSCSFYAVWTTLERLTSIDYSRFVNNKDHLFIQNNRNVIFTNNDLDVTDTGGFPFHIFYTVPGTCQIHHNNVKASPSGWYVNLRSGVLHIENNFWYSTDSATIYNGFLDSHNDPLKTGISNFMPFLEEQVQAGPR